jgi:hypothetical protein
LLEEIGVTGENQRPGACQRQTSHNTNYYFVEIVTIGMFDCIKTAMTFVVQAQLATTNPDK